MATTKEAAQVIRSELKAAGIAARSVSVRIDCYSMGSSIKVTIKDPTVSKSKVEAIANRQSRVRRDDLTGEILCGGNRFVDVEYCRDMTAPLSAKVLSKFEHLQAPTSREDGSPCVEVLDEKVFRSDRYDWRTFGRTDDDMGIRAYDAATLARCMVEAALDRGEAAAVLAL